MARFNVLLDFTVKGAEATAKAVGDVAKNAEKTGSVMASLEVGVGKYINRLAGIAVAAISIQKVASFVHESVVAFGEAEQVAKRFEQAIASSANEAGHNARQLLELAERVSDLSGLDDELVISAQAVLLSFNKIGREAFPRATQAAADMSAAFGYELKDSISIVGKALQEPERASYLLAKAKVFLTTAQKAEIEQFAKAGDVYKAQDVILNRLADTLGGRAASSGDTFQGSLNRLNTATGNLKEALGEGLAPALSEVVNGLRDVASQQETIEFFRNLGVVLGVVVKGLGGVTGGVADMLATTKRRFDIGMGGANSSQIKEELALATERQKKAQALVDLYREQGYGAGAILQAERSLEGAKKKTLGLTMMLADAQALEADLARSQSEIENKNEQQRQQNAARSLADALKQVQSEGKLTSEQLARIAKLKSAQEVLWQAEEYREQNRQAAARRAEEAAKKAIEDAKRLREEAVRGLEALRTPQAKLVDQIAEWRDRFRKGIIDAKELEAALAGIARSNPFDRIQYQRPADTSPQELAQVMSVVITPIRLDLDKFRMTEEQLAGLRQEAAQMTEFLVTEEERRNALLKDAEWLLGAGAMSQEKYNKLVEHFAKVSSEEAILATERLLDSLLGNASNAFNYLADQFGGFFNYLADAANALQRARGFGQSVAGVASSFTANTSTIATAGYVGTVVAIFAEVYSFVDKMIEKKNSLKYGTNAGYAEGSGGSGMQGSFYLNDQGQKIYQALRELSRSIEDSLGVFIEDLDAIRIDVRNDGNKVLAYVKGELVGVFSSVDDAMREAMRVALQGAGTTITGLSDLMRQGLSEFVSPDFDELMSFLGQLKEISDLSKSSGQIQLEQTLHGLQTLMETLSRVREITPAVIAGYGDIASAIGDAWQQWSDAITGRQRSAAEELESKKAEAALFNAKKAMYVAELQLTKLELEARKAELVARGVMGNGLMRWSRDNIERGRDIYEAEMRLIQAGGDMRQMGLDAEWQYMKSVGTLEGERLRMTNAALDAINAQLAAIDAIIANLPGNIDPGSIRLPGGGGRRQELQSFEEELRAIIEAALPDLVSQFREVREQMQRVREEAARLRADQALTEEALRALSEGLRDTLQDMLDAVFGGSEWDQRADEIRQKWAEVTQAVREHLDATGERLIPFWQINAAMAEELRQLAEEAIGSLGITAESARDEMQQLTDTMQFLRDAVDAGTLSSERFSQIMGELGGQIYSELLQGMAQYVQDEVERAALEAELREAAFDAQKIQWALEIAHYEELGLLTAEQIARLRELLGSLPEDLPYTPPSTGGGSSGGGSSGGTDQFFQRQQDAINRAKDLLERYINEAAEAGLSPFQRDLRRLNADFDEIRRVLGDTAEVQRAYAASLKALHDRYLQSIRDFRRELALGEDSGLTPAARFQRLQEEMRRLLAAVNQGDLSQAANIPAIAQQMLQLYGQLYGGATGGGPSGGYANFVAWLDSILARISGGTPTGQQQDFQTRSMPTASQRSSNLQGAANDVGREPLLAEVRSLRTALERGLESVATAQTKTANALARIDSKSVRKSA